MRTLLIGLGLVIGGVVRADDPEPDKVTFTAEYKPGSAPYKRWRTVIAPDLNITQTTYGKNENDPGTAKKLNSLLMHHYAALHKALREADFANLPDIVDTKRAPTYEGPWLILTVKVGDKSHSVTYTNCDQPDADHVKRFAKVWKAVLAPAPSPNGKDAEENKVGGN